jgi:molybdopterin converting factor small subunit
VIDGTTVREVLDGAIARYGDEFDAVLRTCRVWVNGESADQTTVVGESDEVAVLPPVSGGH